MSIYKPPTWCAIFLCLLPPLVLAGMDGFPSLTLEEAKELGFEIELEPSTSGNCRINISVTAPDALDGRKYLGMNYALYRGEELLFFPDDMSDRKTYSFLISAELLPSLVVLPVFSDDKRGYGYQLLFTDVEWSCE